MAMKPEKPSIMARKFQELAEKNKFRGLEEEHGLRVPASETGLAGLVGIFKKCYCFLYGTLMEPEKLASVIELPDNRATILRPAKLVGYHTKLWGDESALLAGPQGSEVLGKAYEIQSPKELLRLRAYDRSGKYEHGPCVIQLLDAAEGDENEVKGNTFMWDGKMEELSEGQFSLEEFQQQQQKEKGSE